MRYRRLVAALILASFSAISFLGIATANAQSQTSTPAPSGGLRITPAITQIHLQPHEQTLSLQYQVSNLTPVPLTIVVGAQDFGALSQSGSITLYGSDYNPATNPHGIQMSVSYPEQNIVIPANSAKQVVVNITNTDKLAPGGHYGAILFSPQGAFSSATNNRVDLNTSVAGLVFLTTAQGGTYGISASVSHVSPVVFKFPSSAYLVFKNTGNTQTIPQGQLTLLSPRRQVMSTQVVNSSSGLVLSGGSRIFQVALPPSASWHTLPGLYHLQLQYKDSQDVNFKTLDQTFLYINWTVMLLAIIALVLALVVVRLLIYPLTKKLIPVISRTRLPKRKKANGMSNSTTSEGRVMDVVSLKRPKKRPPEQ